MSFSTNRLRYFVITNFSTKAILLLFKNCHTYPIPLNLTAVEIKFSINTLKWIFQEVLVLIEANFVANYPLYFFLAFYKHLMYSYRKNMIFLIWLIFSNKLIIVFYSSINNLKTTSDNKYLMRDGDEVVYQKKPSNL